MNEEFYDRMADYYHLIFEDWDASMRRQGAAIAKLLPPPDKAGPILDIACGIGTQSLALAALGYAVTGSDISADEVARANREAVARGLTCIFGVDDMRTLESAEIGKYGAVIALDILDGVCIQGLSLQSSGPAVRGSGQSKPERPVPCGRQPRR
jgi:glycine/sarcosine N-methyltransferase